MINFLRKSLELLGGLCKWGLAFAPVITPCGIDVADPWVSTISSGRFL